MYICTYIYVCTYTYIYIQMIDRYLYEYVYKIRHKFIIYKKCKLVLICTAL